MARSRAGALLLGLNNAMSAFAMSDWSYYVDSVWRLSVPIELVPDLAAWIVCGCMAIWLARFVAFRRPRTCCLAVLAWLGWLSWQAMFVNGIQALHGARRRGVAALEATDHFSQHLLALVKAWTDFFLPFMSDVARWGFRIWKKMSVRQRLIGFFVSLTVWTIIQAVNAFRRHKLVIMHVIFHASFLIGGPLLWYSSSLLPADVLPWLVGHLITTFPTVMSLLVINNASDGDSPRRTLSGRPDAAPLNVTMHRLWLSFWACYPALALLEAAVGMAPRLAPEHGRGLEIELQRALLVFVVWLQFWQGSRVLHYTMQKLLFNKSLLEYVARFFGARGLQALSIMRGGMTGGSPWRGLTFFRFMKKLTSRLWLVGVGLAAAVLIMLVLVTLFYRAVAFVSSVVTALLWIAAATDSADTLTRRAEEFYTKKLSFWVLAMLWEASTKLPYVGFVLRLFSPVAFSLWLLVGETVLRYAVLPVMHLVGGPLNFLLSGLGGAFRAMLPFGSAGEPEDEEEEEEEEEAEEEQEEEAEEELAEEELNDAPAEESVEKPAPAEEAPLTTSAQLPDSGGERDAPSDEGGSGEGGVGEAPSVLSPAGDTGGGPAGTPSVGGEGGRSNNEDDVALVDGADTGGTGVTVAATVATAGADLDAGFRKRKKGKK